MKKMSFVHSCFKSLFLKTGIVIVLNFLVLNNVSAQCNTIDQSQLNYNGGMSARNLPGYSEWQNFTAGTTGTLCQVDIGFFNFISGTGTFNIFSGTGTSGTLLQTQQVTVTGSGNFFFPIATAVPVVAGSIYTFQFIPIQGGGIPDPYGVQVENPGTYLFGEMYLVDPSGTYPTGFDMVFKTYVTVSTNVNMPWNTMEYVSASPNPFSESCTLRFAEKLNQGSIKVFNELGKEVYSVADFSEDQFIFSGTGMASGIYFIKISDGNRNFKVQKVLLRNP